tara:strand:+ start:176 stop:1519 length:1344 start_codon:yes stop_codon:yes gene_type:complete
MYHKDIYNFDTLPNSYWHITDNKHKTFNLKSINNNKEFDILIIGAGYTGLSCALNLLENYNLNVGIVDAGSIGWGASSRNAGFCCIPPTKLTVDQLIKKNGKKETIKFFENCIEGSNYTKELIDKYNIECDISGNKNYVVAHSIKKFDELIKESKIYNNLFNIKSEIFDRNIFSKIGHSGEEQFGALSYEPGFALNPLKFVNGLTEKVLNTNGKIYIHSKVDSIKKINNIYIANSNSFEIKAKKIVVATNGFYQEGLIKELDSTVMPIISNIIVTKPLTETQIQLHNFKTFSPIVNTRNLLYYYRKLPDNRILFGARGDMNGSFKSHQKYIKKIEINFKNIFPHWKNIDIDYTWRGLVAFTSKLSPSIGKIDNEDIFYSFGYHANGVSSAPWLGMQLSKLVFGSNNKSLNISKVYKGLPKKIPFPIMKKLYLRLVYLLYLAKDYLKI